MVTVTERLSEELQQEALDKILRNTFDKIGFEPYPQQWEALRCPKKQVFITGGERAGKSTTGSMYTWGRITTGNLFWIVAGDYHGAREEFEKILNAALQMDAVESHSYPAKDKCWIRIKGGILVETKSLRDSKRSIASQAPDGILICETAQIEHEDYLRIIARRAEKDGWVCGTGTLEGSLGWYPDIINYLSHGVEEGQSFSLASWDNTFIYPDGENSPQFVELKRHFPEELYMERFAAKPFKPHGLVAKEFTNEVHVRPLPHQELIPTEVAIDPGYGRGSAHVVLAIQEVAGCVHVIDEIYTEGMITKDMITSVRQKPWGRYVTQGACDIAAKAHAAMTAPYELWAEAGVTLLSKRIMEEDGIDCLRTWLKINPLTKLPILFIDPKCKGLIAECGGGLDLELKRRVQGVGAWMRDLNSGTAINRNNHACKALIYWLVNKYGWSGRAEQEMIQSFTMG